jgi:hypothetical protein
MDNRVVYSADLAKKDAEMIVAAAMTRISRETALQERNRIFVSPCRIEIDCEVIREQLVVRKPAQAFLRARDRLIVLSLRVQYGAHAHVGRGMVGRLDEGVSEDPLGVVVSPRSLQCLGEKIHRVDMVGLHCECALAELRGVVKPPGRLHARRRVQ